MTSRHTKANGGMRSEGQSSLIAHHPSAREDMMTAGSSPSVLVRAANLLGALTIAIALCAPIVLCMSTSARAWDETKYPNFGGQWKRPAGIGNQFDQTKPPREAQKV